MSEDDEVAKSLVSRREPDDQMKSLMTDFEVIAATFANYKLIASTHSRIYIIVQGDADKNSWVNFQQRVAKAPEQVLRYSRSSGAKPLWPIATGRVSKYEIPNCKSCVGPLCFEFHIILIFSSFTQFSFIKPA